jgi:hypothetical protein
MRPSRGLIDKNGATERRDTGESIEIRVGCLVSGARQPRKSAVNGTAADVRPHGRWPQGVAQTSVVLERFTLYLER